LSKVILVYNMNIVSRGDLPKFEVSKVGHKHCFRQFRKFPAINSFVSGEYSGDFPRCQVGSSSLLALFRATEESSRVENAGLVTLFQAKYSTVWIESLCHVPLFLAKGPRS
jgi:hypothetical protein